MCFLSMGFIEVCSPLFVFTIGSELGGSELGKLFICRSKSSNKR